MTLRGIRERARSMAWNPVLENELRARMRGWPAPFLVSVFLGLVAITGYGAVKHAAGLNAGDTLPPTAAPGILRTMVYTELILVLFVAPALTAAAISGERERGRLDVLRCSRMRPLSILLGKLISSLLFILLLMLLSVPLFGIVFLFGGIELGQVLSVAVIGLMTAAALGSLGLLCSTIARSSRAMVAGYVLAFSLVVGPLLLTRIASAPSPSNQPTGPVLTAYELVDPLVAVGASLPPGTDPGDRDPISQIVNPPEPAQAPASSTSSDLRLEGDRIVQGPFTRWHVWQVFTLFNLIVSGLALGGAAVMLDGRRTRRHLRALRGPQLQRITRRALDMVRR